jgi:hypothetical protein
LTEESPDSPLFAPTSYFTGKNQAMQERILDFFQCQQGLMTDFRDFTAQAFLFKNNAES